MVKIQIKLVEKYKELAKQFKDAEKQGVSAFSISLYKQCSALNDQMTDAERIECNKKS
jgi:hypothetical protein